MAIWQFDFYLLPASSVEPRFRAVPVTVSADEYDRVRWWEGINLRRAIEHDLSKMLSPHRSRSFAYVSDPEGFLRKLAESE